MIANTAKHILHLQRNNFLNRFLLVITVFYTAGIITGRLFLIQSPGYLIFSLSIMVILFIAAINQWITIFYALLLILAAFSGIISFYYPSLQIKEGLMEYANRPLYLEGTVIGEPVVYSDHSVYIVQSEKIEIDREQISVTDKLEVRIYGDGSDRYWFGEKLRIRGTIVEPRGRRNPDGFDYRLYLQSQGISALMYPNPAQVSSLGTGRVGWLTHSAINLRQAMTGSIMQNLPPPASELLTAMLFGQRYRLSEEVEENFRRSGAGHLMAVSGLHVGLVALIILGFFQMLKIKGRFPLLLAIILVFAYAYLTGMRPPALRAAIMVSAALAALLLDREKDLPSAIALAALVTLSMNPSLLFTVGFQLSYAATLTIIYAYRPVEHLLRSTRAPRILHAPLTVTISAQIGVLPLSLYYFHHLPVGALGFNLLLMPLIAFIIGFGLTGALLSFIWPLAGSILLWAARPLLELMIFLTGISKLPGFYLTVYPPGLLTLIAIYLLMAGIIYSYHYRNILFESVKKPGFLFCIEAVHAVKNNLIKPHIGKIVVIILLIAVVLVWGGIIFPGNDDLRVTFIDVGQGAAVLIETPCSAVIMVDAGGEPAYSGNPAAVGEKVVLPYLRSQGIRYLDLAIITHPHEDHFGGFIPLIGTIPVEQLLISPAAGNSELYDLLLTNAINAGTKVIEAVEGMVWTCGDDLQIEIISPPGRLLTGIGSDLNNNSVVALLRYKEFVILLTGDIEDAAAVRLLGKNINLSAHVLQVPHHGGYMDSFPEFIEAVSPTVAVIQTGPNPFGHPHPYIIDTLEEIEVITCRTDLHGAVIVKSDGYLVEVETVEQPVLFK
ncbi:MAG: DNA internalization-related competence protein ComEC/Rec2 [Bacillota bacterium]|nr:DNA internalization-related competence protein ComEC/Rec2 [Bacillota bacterium]